MHPPRFLLSNRLADWPACTLEVNCCKGKSFLPMPYLIERHGNLTFAEILTRLRCERCRRFQPAPVYLCAGHREFCHGAPPDWAIELVPVPPLIKREKSARVREASD